jgi:hypothetical protein
MKITRKVKDILRNLPPECPTCRSTGGTPTLCSMCFGVRELRQALGATIPSTYAGNYDENNQWRWDEGRQP